MALIRNITLNPTTSYANVLTNAYSKIAYSSGSKDEGIHITVKTYPDKVTSDIPESMPIIARIYDFEYDVNLTLAGSNPVAMDYCLLKTHMDFINAISDI